MNPITIKVYNKATGEVIAAINLSDFGSKAILKDGFDYLIEEDEAWDVEGEKKTLQSGE